ncbi:MAG: hypothetical protein GXO09_02020 [Crenarchaeota archaeon]|nr:hypothetical protein [Thermoproteota archaeon]
MAELLRGLGKLLGLINYTRKTIEDAVKDTFLEMFRNIGGDALLKVIYTFPEPVNSIEDELAPLRLGDLERLCGGRVDVDCLLRILGVSEASGTGGGQGGGEERGADTRGREPSQGG